MKNKRLVLLKTLFRASGNLNILKYSTDKKKRSTARLNIIGMIILYVVLLVYCVAVSIGFGEYGMTEAIPKTTVLTISIISFIFTLLKTNGYMFNFREYDTIMSMPFPVRQIVEDKFMYMYMQSLPIMVITSVSMMIGYGIYVNPGVFVYVIWTALSFVIPLIPMVVASLIGALFARIGSGMRNKNIVQSILVFAFVIAMLGGRFVLEDNLGNGETEQMMTTINTGMNGASEYYLPAEWFERSVSEGSLLMALLFVAVSVAVASLFVLIVSRSYRKINSALASGSAHVTYHMKEQKKRSVVNAVAFKEFKRFMGSTTYLTNVGLGVIFTVVIGIVVLFVDADKIVSSVLQDAPITTATLLPAIPILFYMMVGMVPSTCCSFSLEGRNFWILKSMPVDMMDIVKGKMRFNILLFLPGLVFASITTGISAHAGFIDIALIILCGAALLVFSTCFGARCGLKHLRLDWENEIEVIKQGSAVSSYLIPNMLATLVMLGGSVALGVLIGGRLVMILIAAFALLLAYLSWLSIKRFAAEML